MIDHINERGMKDSSRSGSWYEVGRAGLRAAALTCIGLVTLGCAASPARAPNILFILTDQHRQDCVGAYGNPKIHTPHIDRLAREGARFDRCYTAQPVCSPNRSSIITGLYPHSSGVWENKVPLPKSSRAMSEMLAPAGYDCGYFGKWHLGRRDAFETFPEYPSDARGTNHYFGKGESKRYGVDVITEDTIRFIRQGRSKPFYVYVSFYPPHPPYSVPAEYIERYKDIKDKNERIYYAMCTKVDEKVGEMLAVLDELGIAENTLVVFTTDHGHNFEWRWNHHNKRLCYDPSARIPLVARMPGVIPKGRQVEGLISSVDLVPTMLSLIGQPVPPGVQGQDMSGLARGKVDKGRDYVFMENIPYPYKREKGEERCVMDERYKLILSTHRPPELYDLKEDPREVDNRWGEMKSSDVVVRLIGQLQAWAERTEDELAPRLIRAARP